jgi:hypothetical protein
MRRTSALLVSTAVVACLAAGCGGGSGSDGGSATSTTTTTPRADYTDLEASSITFHPVLEIVSCDGGGIPGDTASTTRATTSSTVPALDGDLCYVLGPAGGSGADLRDAKVYADGVGIEVSVREDAVDHLNQLFDACFEATDACPPSSTEGKGYAAIVIDGRVVSTPAVTEAGLASSPFVITGDFDKTQATEVAAAINAP